MSGRKSRNKGARRERELVHKYMEIPGVFSERVPLSGAMGTYKGDLKIEVGPYQWTAEVKARASGFKQIYTWLGSNDLLHVQADRAEPLAILPWSRWEQICKLLAGIRYDENQI